MEEESNDVEPIKDDISNVTEDDPLKVDVASGSEADVAGEPPRKKQDTHESQDNNRVLSPTETDDRKNPLLNPVVLRHLFQLCPVPILVTCRQVCKLWYVESLIPWRTNVPTTITMKDKDIFIGSGCLRGEFSDVEESSDDEEFSFLDDRINRRREGDPIDRKSLTPPAPQPNQTPLKEFLEFIDKPEYKYETKPYRNVEFDECEFALNPCDFSLIWKSIGSYLTTMSLVECTFSSVDEFRQLIYRRCPILQKLKIDECSIQQTSGAEPHQGTTEEYKGPVYGEHKHLTSLTVDLDVNVTTSVSWLELFSHYTSLNSLEVNEAWREIPAQEEFEKLIQAIKTIRQMDRKKLQFKHFKFPYKLGISRDPAAPLHYALSEEVGLPLDRGNITVIRPHHELDPLFLRRTLRYLAPMVNTIRIKPDNDKHKRHRDSVVPTWFREFPFGIQLDNLSNIEWTCEHLINFTFLKCVPNLTHLSILDSERRGIQITSMRKISNDEKEELADLKMLRLTKFHFEFMVGDDDVQLLSDWMPNITDLEMILSRKQKTNFIQNCKKLEWVTSLGREWKQEGVYKITMRESKKVRITNRRPV